MCPCRQLCEEALFAFRVPVTTATFAVRHNDLVCVEGTRCNDLIPSTILVPQVYLEPHEIQSVKAAPPHTIRVLGFKSTSCLKEHHQLRSSSFVYPGEVVGEKQRGEGDAKTVRHRLCGICWSLRLSVISWMGVDSLQLAIQKLHQLTPPSPLLHHTL